MKKILLFAFSLVMFFAACEDETADFTIAPTNPADPSLPGSGIDTIIPEDEICWKAPISVSIAADFNHLFTRYSGWTGGDATYSIPLPDGRILWIFGDSFIGAVNADRSRPQQGLYRNAFVVQDGEELTTLSGGSTAFMEPKESGWWYWPGHGYAHDDTLQVVMYGFKATGGGAWDFDYASLDVATFSLPEIKLLSVERKFTDPSTNYGAAIMEKDGYLYVYGMEKQGLSKFLHTARVKGKDLNGQWEYFTGTDWSDNPEESVRHFAHVSDEFCVFEYKGRYYLLTQHHILGGEIYIYDSDNPVNGFANQRIVYCTPQTDKPDLITYNAFAHLQFSSNGELLVSYNVNSQNFNDLFSDADKYRPYFVRIRGWD